jgi:hypothetical protein
MKAASQTLAQMMQIHDALLDQSQVRGSRSFEQDEIKSSSGMKWETFSRLLPLFYIPRSVKCRRNMAACAA